MSDGRDIINQAYKTVREISKNLDEVKKNFSEKESENFENEVKECVDWAKKCRNKVWLRSKEGADMAQGCLDAVLEIEKSLDSGGGALSAAEFAKFKLESLAKVIATKASVMT
jgi:hypothetical protein